MRRVLPLPSLTFQPWLQQHASQLVAISVRPMTRDLQLHLPCADLQQLSKLDLQQIQLSVAPTGCSLLPSLKRLKLFNCSRSAGLVEQLPQLSRLTRLKLVRQKQMFGSYDELEVDAIEGLLQRLTGL